MQTDQWGEILEAGPDKEKPLISATPPSIQEIGVDQLSDVGQKVRRYGTAKARNRQMAGFLVQGSTSRQHPYVKLSRKMYECAEWLEFHHYYHRDQIRLAKTSLCRVPLLCPVCAIRRGVKTLRNYHERAMHLSATHDLYMLTLTVKNGPDLWERYQHLKHSFKRLRERAKKGYGAWATVAGAVWSTEFTKGVDGWHPHLHMLVALPKGSAPIRYGKDSQLAMDWLSVTGDSFIVHSGGNITTTDDIGAGLCEVLKYALKFSDLDLADNLHAYETLKGKRLIQASGVFFGLELPETADLMDELLDEPYVRMFFRYTSRGYSLQSSTLVDTIDSEPT